MIRKSKDKSLKHSTPIVLRVSSVSQSIAIVRTRVVGLVSPEFVCVVTHIIRFSYFLVNFQD